VVLSAQILMQAPGTPSGTLFTESFGDTGTLPCGYGVPWNTGLYSYTGCDVIWGKVVTGTGGSVAIGASPNTNLFPQGPKSLLITTGTTTTYVQTVGFLPTIPSGTTFDMSFTIRVHSLTLNSGSTSPLMMFSTDQAGSTWPFLIQFNPVTNNVPALYCQGNTSTKSPSLTIDADNTVTLHVVLGGGAGSSTCSLNGTQWGTWQAKAVGIKYIAIGDIQYSAANATYAIGNLKITTATQGPGAGPSVAVIPSNSGQTTGTAITTSNIASPTTIGGNCTWTQTGSGMNPLTFSSSNLMNLLSPIDVFGVQYGATSTMGVSYNLANGSTAYSFEAQCISFSPVWSWGYRAETSYVGNDGGNASMMSVTSGSDYLSNNFIGSNNPMTVDIESLGGTGGTPDIGAIYASWTSSPLTSYFINNTYELYAVCLVGADCMARGSLTSGTFMVGETMTQGTSGATATFVGIGGTGSLHSIEAILASGTPDATHVWTGGTSGATYTPTTVLVTFHTMKIYDANCNLLNTQKNIASSSTPTLAQSFYIGRIGDTGNPSRVFNIDWYQLDYARGNPIVCR
jgi:hypothetical protein